MTASPPLPHPYLLNTQNSLFPKLNEGTSRPPGSLWDGWARCIPKGRAAKPALSQPSDSYCPSFGTDRERGPHCPAPSTQGFLSHPGRAFCPKRGRGFVSVRVCVCLPRRNCGDCVSAGGGGGAASQKPLLPPFPRSSDSEGLAFNQGLPLGR